MRRENDPRFSTLRPEVSALHHRSGVRTDGKPARADGDDLTDVAGSVDWLRAFDNSLVIGLGTTILSTFLGVTAALGPEGRSGGWGRYLPRSRCCRC
jgi:hypothetical protein